MRPSRPLSRRQSILSLLGAAALFAGTSLPTASALGPAAAGATTPAASPVVAHAGASAATPRVAPSAATAPSSPGGFGSIAPARVLDTRFGTGTAGVKAPVKANGTIAVRVAGVGGVPASGVAAVAVNVTVTGPTGPGFITAYASGTTRPVASNLNFTAGQTVPNLVIAPVGADGKIALFNGSGGTANLIADVSGYYLDGKPANVGAFGSVAPTRVLDTRSGVGTGGSRTPVAAGRSTAVSVSSVPGLPSTGVSAVAVNVTVVRPSASGFVTAYADGTARPSSSNLNFSTGQTVPNLVVVPVSANGKFDLYNGSGGTTHLIADVAGYYLDGDPTAATAGAFGAVSPRRMLDTRTGIGASGVTAPVAANGAVSVKVTGYGATAGVPVSGVAAVAINVTVTSPTAAGYLSAYASGSSRPIASNLNFSKGQTVPNLVIAPVGPDGKITLFNGSAGTTHVIADIAGYYLDDAPVFTPQVTWTPTQVVNDHTGGFLRSLSCPTNDFCMALDSYDNQITYSSGAWHSPTPLDPTRAAVWEDLSCSSPTFCMAVGSDGTSDDTAAARYSLWDGHSWSAPAAAVAVPLHLVSVTCPADGGCVAASLSGTVARYESGTWSAFSGPAPVPSPNRVRCASTDTCVVADRDGNVSELKNGTWTARHTIGGATGLQDVSCAAPSTCMLLDDNGKVSRYDGASWTAPVQVLAPNETVNHINVLACATPSFCRAVSGSGATETWNGSAWSAASTLASTDLPVRAGSCPTPTTCFFGGDTTVHAGNDAAWTTTTVNPVAGGFRQVACPSTSQCFAVTHDQLLWQWQGGTWAAVPGVTALELACSGPTFCMLAGSDFTRTWDGTAWSTPTTVYAYELACPSPTLCLAVSADGPTGREVMTWRSGTWGTSVTIPLAAPSSTFVGINGLACASPTRCIATMDAYPAQTSYVSEWNGTSWTAAHAPVAGPQSPVSSATCAVTQCYASTADGRWLEYAGTRWFDTHAGAVSPYGACPADNRCVALWERASDVWDGTTWTSTPKADWPAQWGVWVSCPSAHTCVAVSEGGDVTVGTIP